MSDFSRVLNQNPLPLPAIRAQADIGLDRWREVTADFSGESAEMVHSVAADPGAQRLLEAVFGGSPFLTHCIVREPEFAARLLRRGPDEAFAFTLSELRAAAAVPAAEIGRALRIAKRRGALAIAVADIAGAWPLERVTAALSDLAETTLNLAARAHLREAHARGVLVLPDGDEPERNSGLIVIGMGKLGARELNYSSDIDLIVLYETDVIETADADALQQGMVRLTRGIVKTMDERTADGYVFRTDLRLRPDPGSTPVAISAYAAELYYESLGQNWERAAMIKARPVAGDLGAGQAFLDRLRPFIWRKNLDFAAIQDIHSIKRQINAHRGGSKIAVCGHNIKLGRGGIREIEFYAQTQQLIWGGRLPELRGSATCETLRALALAERITPEAAQEMIEAYHFLRRIEHRLQMIDDRQTQTLPEDDAGMEHLARFAGYPDTEPFVADLLTNLRLVEQHYGQLFEDANDLGAAGEAAGNLVFTGGDSDPDTLATLKRLGYANPQAVDATVRGWHHGRYRCMRSTRARELLTELMPTLLSSLAATANPDAAFMKFDEFMSRLPAGVQLFSMFHSNPELLDLVAELMGGAPRLADKLSRNPSLLEAVLTQDFFDPLPRAVELDEELDRQLVQARDFQDVLDVTRRWSHDRRFQVGVQTLRGSIEAQGAALCYSDLADSALSRLLPRVEMEFEEAHGRVGGLGMAVVGLGKLGSREMTPTSDLDLIFVYDVPDPGEMSDGRRPIPASQYFARLSQRFINAITAQTAEGTLYEVDMRLRPSGTAGPIASAFDTFDLYQRNSAWTWEHMALTRARVVAGAPPLRERIEGVIRGVLTRPRDPDVLVADVAEMRERMDREHHSDFAWEIKHRRGGLVDIEFITQYLQLRHAHAHAEVLATGTRDALIALREAGVLAAGPADTLLSALRLWQAVQNMLRLTLEGYFGAKREGEISEGLRAALMLTTGAENFNELTAHMAEAAGAVMGIFGALIDEPARPIIERRKQEGTAP